MYSVCIEYYLSFTNLPFTYQLMCNELCFIILTSETFNYYGFTLVLPSIELENRSI